MDNMYTCRGARLCSQRLHKDCLAMIVMHKTWLLISPLGSTSCTIFFTSVSVGFKLSARSTSPIWSESIFPSPRLSNRANASLYSVCVRVCVCACACERGKASRNHYISYTTAACIDSKVTSHFWKLPHHL